VVDDDALIALDVEQALMEIGGLSIAIAHRLEDATAFVDGEPFDLVVLDLALGAESGLPLARRLNEEGRPFLVLSGYRAPGLKELPPGRVIEKPFAIDALVAAAARLLGRAG
jgi:DNA-binding response OmpR family regulator